MPRAFNCSRELSLINRFGSGHATGKDLPAVGNESSKQFIIGPIDFFNLIICKIAALFSSASITSHSYSSF